MVKLTDKKIKWAVKPVINKGESTELVAAIYVKSYLGDSYIGKTPHTDTAVSPGNYTITLTLAGYQDWTEEIQVTSGETAYIF